MNILVTWGVFLFILIINFLPTIIAFARKNTNKAEVLLLNGIPYALSLLLVFVEIPLLNPISDLLNIVLWVAALIKAIKR